VNQAAVERFIEKVGEMHRASRGVVTVWNTGTAEPAPEPAHPAGPPADPSDALVARLQAMYRLIAEADIGGYLNMLTDDVEFEIVGPPGLPIVGRWRGRSAVVEATARNFSLFEDQRPEVLRVTAGGDTVVISGRERGRYRPTGREYELHFVQFFTFRGGRLARFHQVFDTAALLAAAWIMPATPPLPMNPFSPQPQPQPQPQPHAAPPADR
jgi:ketosteroid isomerase-like protein